MQPELTLYIFIQLDEVDLVWQVVNRTKVVGLVPDGYSMNFILNMRGT